MKINRYKDLLLTVTRTFLGSFLKGAMWTRNAWKNRRWRFAPGIVTTDHVEAEELMPAWFVPRMMGEAWTFGLLMTSGHVLAINGIQRIAMAADGSLWVDVVLCTHRPHCDRFGGVEVTISPTSRAEASINVMQIVAAVELAES
jgi:hypothetical protein